MAKTPKQILLVEDNPADIRLFTEAMIDCDLESEIAISVADDGISAIEHLSNFNYRPDLIILDLNLPQMDGREVLTKIKNDNELKMIPVIVFTSSETDEDIAMAYNRHANCYIKKPVVYDNYIETIKEINKFWSNVSLLPPQNTSELIKKRRQHRIGNEI